MVGNVYHVGSANLACFLITTPKGHILLDSGFEETVPLIQASVEKLGFRFGDIKILLTSHAHSDHVAGHARIKELTGAQVMVMQGDEGVVARGGSSDEIVPRNWRPAAVDRVLHDGDEVELGGVKLVARLPPGHTRGCTTWTLLASEGGRTYNVVVVGSLGVTRGARLVNNTAYPEIADDHVRAFRVLKTLPCDVFLANHGAFYICTEHRVLLSFRMRHRALLL